MLKQLTNKVDYMPHYSETDRPALGLICGDNFSVIVDSGNSPSHACDFLGLVDKMDIPPVKVVVYPLALGSYFWDGNNGIRIQNFVNGNRKKG